MTLSRQKEIAVFEIKLVIVHAYLPKIGGLYRPLSQWWKPLRVTDIKTSNHKESKHQMALIVKPLDAETTLAIVCKAIILWREVLYLILESRLTTNIQKVVSGNVREKNFQG